MQIDHLFGGSALEAVDDDGAVRLPRFVRTIAERRSDDRTLVIGAHDADECLTAYDPAYRKLLYAEGERLRLREEPAAGGESARARRAFGLTEEAGYDAAGRIVLPAMMRRLGRIERLALFVGTGGAVEIWNPHLAAESGDESLRALARHRLGHDDSTQPREGMR